MATQSSQSQDQGADKNAYYMLWMIALIGAVCGLVWYFFDSELKQFFITVRIYELAGIHFVLNALPTNIPWMGEILQKAALTVSGYLTLAKQLSPNTLGVEVASVLSTVVGEYLRYPVALYLVILSLLVYKTNVHIRLKKKYNMQSLAKHEEKIWPQIKVVNKLDLLNEDLETGPWAMAMTPMQFAKKNKLISVDYADLKGSQFSKMQAPEYKVLLDRLRAERAFGAQLGRTWQGIEYMAPHRRAIFAVFAARGGRDTKKALELVDQLANSAASGTLDYTGADDLWKKHIKNPAVIEKCERHAYEFTVFISMLLYAREDGVMASADFLWVKPLDRRLWYVINNVGRQTPNAEVAGIFSHWYTEMTLKRALSVPRVEEAVDALERALSEIIYIPDAEEKEEIKKRHAESVTPTAAVE